MVKNCRAKDRSSGPVPLSGPHICSQVGQDILSVAKNALLAASARSKGGLTSAEIENIFDLLANAPEVFALYTHNFNACADIHKKRSFAKISTASFSRFVLQFYCKNTVRQVFHRQIAQSNDQWIGSFLEGLLLHIEQTTDPRFTKNIFGCYRELSLSNGAKLDLSLVFQNRTLHNLTAAVFEKLRLESADDQSLGNTVNRHIGQAHNVSGPSPLKVVDKDLKEFFRLLIKDLTPMPLSADTPASIEKRKEIKPEGAISPPPS
ncbi:MAG: hypothetical protein K8F25_17405 [Fimbriimonadaceae bacterium]|nr:hypothetical protein [Alphaproteobacteria bacterium]